jgi:DNA mismatch endonuclease (patch repair protein)
MTLKAEAIMDVLNPAQRHKAMKRIKAKDTSIEVKLRKALWHEGYRYRKNYKALPGKPDIALTKQRIVIFCDSDFFHGKDWDLVLKPRLLKGKNPEFWIKKIEKNMARDVQNNQELAYLGWSVIRFWGSDIEKDLDMCVKTIEEFILEQIISNPYA